MKLAQVVRSVGAARSVGVLVIAATLWIGSLDGRAGAAVVVPAAGLSASAKSSAALPLISVDKTATPLSRPAPGGDFTFNIVVTNAGSAAFVITSMTDDIYGNLATRPGSTCNTAVGTVVQPSPGPGNTYNCNFTAPFTSLGGATQTDVVVVTAESEGDTAVDSDDATVSITAVASGEPFADFDGNGTTDVSVFRPGNNTWYLRTASPTAVVWGAAGDIPVPGDYDGNGTTDIAVFRPGNNTWYLRTASPTAVVWGAAGDIPVPGKYDFGDMTDIAVFRPGNGTWYLRTFDPTPTAVVWGQNGDTPEPGDYDGDGRTDLAVFRPGNSTWYLRTFSPIAVVWGANGDQPLPLPQAIDRVFFP